MFNLICLAERYAPNQSKHYETGPEQVAVVTLTPTDLVFLRILRAAVGAAAAAYRGFSAATVELDAPADTCPWKVRWYDADLVALDVDREFRRLPEGLPPQFFGAAAPAVDGMTLCADPAGVYWRAKMCPEDRGGYELAETPCLLWDDVDRLADGGDAFLPAAGAAGGPAARFDVNASVTAFAGGSDGAYGVAGRGLTADEVLSRLRAQLREEWWLTRGPGTPVEAFLTVQIGPAGCGDDLPI